MSVVERGMHAGLGRPVAVVTPWLSLEVLAGLLHANQRKRPSEQGQIK